MIGDNLILLNNKKGLSLIFSICCIIDLFGVFPVIALPRAIIECGWYGIPLAVIVFTIQIYTAIMLGRCWVIAENFQNDILDKSRYPYAAMFELAYGKIASKYVTVILGLAVFGGSVPNLIVGQIIFIISAQDLQLLGLKLSSYGLDFSYCYWMVIIGVTLCPIMWLGSPKDLKGSMVASGTIKFIKFYFIISGWFVLRNAFRHLPSSDRTIRWLAVGSVGFVLTASSLTWYCLIQSKPPEVLTIPDPSWESMAIAYGILAFQFDIHPMILTVQMDMENRNELGQAIFFAFIGSGGLFIVTTLLCYLRFGTSIHYNTLQGLEPSLVLYVDFAIVTLQIGLSMVVGASPLFQDLEHTLNIPPGFSWKRCLLRTGVVVAAVIVGEVVPRFDLIMGLIGGSLMGQLMFVFPPLLYSRLRTLQAKVSTRMSRPIRHASYGSLRQMVMRYQMSTAGYKCRADLPLAKDRQFQKGTDTNGHVERGSSCLSFVSLEKALEEGPETVKEKITNILLILFGISAAILSTYYSLKGTIKYADFTPPCISNVTLASKLIYRFA